MKEFTIWVAAAAAKSLQLCLTLCNPIDGSPQGSPIPGILQARTRVGCHFLLQCMKVKSESEVSHSVIWKLFIVLKCVSWKPISVEIEKRNQSLNMGRSNWETFIKALEVRIEWTECEDSVKSGSESHSVVSNFANPWTTQSMEFSRPEYWSGKP